jgi:hypothetical protein
MVTIDEWRERREAGQYIPPGAEEALRKLEEEARETETDSSSVSPPDLVPQSKHGGGPRTPEGKKASSRNATKHGILSPDPTAKGEEPEDWRAFLDANRESLGPKTAFEEELVYSISVDQWNLRRVVKSMTALIEVRQDKAPFPRFRTVYENRAMAYWSEDKRRALLENEKNTEAAKAFFPEDAEMDRLLRYQTTLERSIDRKLRWYAEQRRIRKSA